MKDRYLYMGGVIQLRKEGKMVDRSGNPVAWETAIVITQGKKSMTVGRNCIEAILALPKEPDFDKFLKTCMP